MQFHTGDYLPLDEGNDYLFDPAHRDFAEFRRVAVYRDEQAGVGRRAALVSA